MLFGMDFKAICGNKTEPKSKYDFRTEVQVLDLNPSPSDVPSR
jgi:hypothetical protein